VDGATILIVDDEPRVLDALEAVLAAEFRILRASSGPAALERLRAEDVAVVLTDYKMPGMTGVEMLRECQALAPEAIRLVLTAYTDVDSLMDAVNTGHIYHFVAKPWDSNELLVILRRAVERHALAQENARLRDELEIAYNAVRRQVAEIRARPSAFDTVTGAAPPREAIGRARKVLDTQSPSSCGVRPAPARSCSPGSSTRAAAAVSESSSRRIAAPCRRRCWSPSSSATCAVRSPAPSPSAAGSSRRRTAAPFCWTRSGR
jgi:CheY-like chemotaxis protein